MKVTIQKYKKKSNGKPDLFGLGKETIILENDTADAIMKQIEEYRNNNDVSKFTPWEITWIED